MALVVFALALRAGTASAADSMPKQRLALSASLVTPFFGAYELEGTARISESFALLVNTSYLSLEHPTDDAWKSYAGTLGAGIDYFVLPDTLRRVYLEAIGEIVFTSWHYRATHQVAPLSIGYTAIALLGYRYVAPVGLVLDAGAGAVAIHFPSARVALAGGDSAASKAFTNVYPALKLNVGWAF